MLWIVTDIEIVTRYHIHEVSCRFRKYSPTFMVVALMHSENSKMFALIGCFRHIQVKFISGYDSTEEKRGFSFNLDSKTGYLSEP
jgi:hypothetical protein